VFCAVGTLLSDLKHAYVRTYAADVDGLAFDEVGAVLGEMRAEAIQTLRAEQMPDDRVDLQFGADLRYVAQFQEVEVPIHFDGTLTEADVDGAVAAFHDKHESLYGYAMRGTPIELINLRLTALGRTDKPALEQSSSGGEDPSHARKASRQAFFDGDFREVDVFDGLALKRDNRVVGPAIVEQPTTTVVVTSGYDLTVDAYGNYVLQPKQ
jgi:N-methylhydantoinase A